MRLLVDTNLLILYVAGRTSKKIISAHKRLRTYTLSDYDLLLKYIGRFDGLLLTTNTMTEASNLLSLIGDPYRSDLRAGLRQVAAQNVEVAVASRVACRDPDYLWLGLTDAAILVALNSETTVLTVDLDLYNAATGRGMSAVNFEHIRGAQAPG